MKIGTSNFYGERLTQAREVMGITQAALAEHIGVKKQAVSAYEMNTPDLGENKGFSPSKDVAIKISDFFNLPVNFFTTYKLSVTLVSGLCVSI